MSSSPTARRGVTTALTVFAAAIILFLGFAHGSANAAVVTEGSAVVTINSLSSAKASAIAPATGKKVGKKGVKATAPVKSLNILGSTAKVGLGGGVKLSNGKRSVRITGFSLAIEGNLTVVRGKLGGRNLVIFTASGKATVDKDANKVKLTGAKLKFPPSVAKTVKKKLKLKKAPTGKIGVLTVNASNTTVDPCVANPEAEGCPIVDPYFEQCGIEATSRVKDFWAPATALPAATGSVPTTGPASINWGFRSAFRGYVYGTMASEGKGDSALQALGGASRFGSEMDPTRGFSFPVTNGFYKANTGDTADDQAVVNGSGTALFCNNVHGFWAAITDPTVVIDGANSRIVATISENLNGQAGPLHTAVRVDLAKLDLTGVTPAYGTGTVTWTAVPATLSDSASPFATYPQGPGPVALEPITVTVSTD